MSYQSLYFEDSELDCQDQCGELPTPETIKLADTIRYGFGHPLCCTSGKRCKARQQYLIATGVSRALRSKHLDGDAIDLTPVQQGLLPAFRAYLVANAEILGIWLEDFAATPTWCHIQRVPPPGWKPGMSRIFRP